MAAAFENSNIANLGSEFETKLRLEAAQHEQAFSGAGKKVGIEVWRVEQFKVHKLPPPTNGTITLYSGDAYILLSTVALPSGGLAHSVFFWLGNDSSQDERGVAAYKTVELDDLLGPGGHATQYRECDGYESPAFQRLFQRIIKLDGGTAGGFHHVGPDKYEPRLLQVTGKQPVTVREVPLGIDSFDDGEVLVLDEGLQLYQWNGARANVQQKMKAGELIDHLKEDRHSRPQSTIIDGLEDSPTFWKFFGGKPQVIAAAKPVPAPSATPATTSADRKLYILTDKPTSSSSASSLSLSLLASGRDLNKSLLTSNDVFIIDAEVHIIIYVGRHASDVEKKSAMQYALTYIQQHKLPPHTPISRLVEGNQSTEFESLFH